MRAKEYIVANEATLKYPADIRLQACLLQKELYEKNNAMQTAEPEEFQMREGEIPVEIAAAVRVFLDDSSCESQVAKDLTGRFICEIISRTAAEDKRRTSIEEELNRNRPKETSLDGADETTALRTDRSEFEWIIPGITIPR